MMNKITPIGTWKNMYYKMLELTQDLEKIDEFEYEDGTCYLFNDYNVYSINENDFDLYSLDIWSIQEFFYNKNIELVSKMENCDKKLKDHNGILKERDFLFNKMNEVMPVYNNASVIAVENEKLLKENLELKSSKEALSKFASCSEKVIGELKYEIELLKAGIPYNKED